MITFKAYEEVSYDDHICPSTLTNKELAKAHNDLMECPVNTSFWRELDDELNFRCEEEETMEWPYND